MAGKQNRKKAPSAAATSNLRRSTRSRRARSAKPQRVETVSSKPALTPKEEQRLVDRVLLEVQYGRIYTKRDVALAAQRYFLRNRCDYRKLSSDWVDGFIERHPEVDGTINIGCGSGDAASESRPSEGCWVVRDSASPESWRTPSPPVSATGSPAMPTSSNEIQERLREMVRRNGPLDRDVRMLFRQIGKTMDRMNARNEEMTRRLRSVHAELANHEEHTAEAAVSWR
ncbi:hypothetical protein F5Y17DRAFT_416081 [Xylariaceae sp. FL0594]|nr:hypothetical protein F5Y17DRAFT_416081 [Xylariaceae sp. FL0594]